MGKVSLAELTMANIMQLRERVEVYDQNGTSVGYFEPHQNGSLESEPSSEELDRRERESARYSYDEVWDQIHKDEQV